MGEGTEKSEKKVEEKERRSEKGKRKVAKVSL